MSTDASLQIGSSRRSSESRPTLTPVQAKWARLGWILVAAITLLLILVTIPARYRLLADPLPGTWIDIGRLTPGDVQNLGRLGLSPHFYALLVICLEVGAALAYLGLAALIIWRCGNERYAVFAAYVFAPFGAVTSPLLDTLAVIHPLWEEMVFLIRTLSLGGGIILLYTFPDGRFAPRWSRLPVLLWLLYLAASIFFPALRFLPSLIAQSSMTMLTLLLTFLILACMMVVQLYRYRRIYSPIQRQQAKWVVFGLSMLVTSSLLVSIPLLIGRLAGLSGVDHIAYRILAITIVQTGQIVFAGTFTIAIIRSNLWDINLVVRRTLSYSFLTIFLGMIYFSFIILLQTLFVSAGGQVPEWVVVITTLVIAALFNPLRIRIQARIDHAFHRDKYDIERIFSRFAAGLSHDLDPESLCDHLVQAVDETLQPQKTVIWLRK